MPSPKSSPNLMPYLDGLTVKLRRFEVSSTCSEYVRIEIEIRLPDQVESIVVHSTMDRDDFECRFDRAMRSVGDQVKRYVKLQRQKAESE